MNLTSKKKFVLENNGVAFNPHTSSHNSTSPYKQNEKIIYLPKDFLKNNNIISTPITNTETNITIYNNASKQTTTTNPNTFRCQPNLLLYNKNFYKHPLILKNKHTNNTNTNTTNNTNNNSNNNISAHSQIIPTNINISTIDNKDISVNSSVTINNITKPKGKIVSKVISFSKDKLEQIQQSKQMLCCCYNSEGNVNAQCCSNSSNMIYTRKRSKDRNKLKLIDERRKMCKSVKEINTNTFGEGGECNGYNNSLVTSVEGIIIQHDNNCNKSNNEDSDYSSFGNGQHVITEKDVKSSSMQGKKGSNVKHRIQLTKEVINDNNNTNSNSNNTNTLIHSILNTPSHKNTITINNDNSKIIYLVIRR